MDLLIILLGVLRYVLFAATLVFFFGGRGDHLYIVSLPFWVVFILHWWLARRRDSQASTSA